MIDIYDYWKAIFGKLDLGPRKVGSACNIICSPELKEGGPHHYIIVL